MQALEFAMQFIQALPSLIAAGASLVPLINRTNDALQAMQAEKRGPTPEEWELLNAGIDALRKELHS